MMTTEKLYREEDSKKLESEKKMVIAWLSISFALLVFFTVLFLLLASYPTKVVYQVLLSVTDTLTVFVLVYLFCRLAYLRRLIYEFEEIRKNPGTPIQGKVKSVSGKPITLADRSRVYEVYVEHPDGTGKTYYLSEIFGPSLEKEGDYSLIVAFDYIKEFGKNEDQI